MTTLSIFAQEMNDLAATVETNVVKLQRAVAEEVVQFVSMATPVDTGQAAGNWETSINAPVSSWTQGGSSAIEAISKAKAALAALGPGQTVYISNNVPYIVELNQGSSKQAPAGFVELSTLSAMNVAGNFKLLVK